MLWARKPAPFSAPGSCVIFPGRRADERGFIDTTTTLEGLRGPLQVYISAEGVRTAAHKFPQLGLVDSKQLEDALEHNVKLGLEIDHLRERIAELEATQEAIAGLRKAGFTVQKMKGPRPTKESTS